MEQKEADVAKIAEPSGERYIPNLMTSDVAVEHWHRYAIAARLVASKRVLDIASGEGYGSRLLAQTAQSVTGIDIDAETVARASERYIQSNLSFLCGSCSAIPLDDHSVDVVVSFETLEHHDQHEEMFQEIRRVLAPGGLCIISTPDRVVYSELTDYKNPFHVKELSAAEFQELVSRHFSNMFMLQQKFVRGSFLTGTDKGFLAFYQEDFNLPPEEVPLGPKYLVALASDGAIPNTPSSFLADDTDQAELQRINNLLVQTARDLEAVIAERNIYKSRFDDEVSRLTGLIEDTALNLNNVMIERDHFKNELHELRKLTE